MIKASKFNKTFKILILGDSSVGKSNFLSKSCHKNTISKKKPAVSLDFHIKTVHVRKKLYTLQIWETTGELQFRFLIPVYCKGANGVIIMYDITNPNSLKYLSSFSEIIKDEVGEIPILLIGNKIDLKSNRAITKKKAKEISEDYNVSSYIEISSKTGKNVSKVFKLLTKDILTSCQV